MFQTFEPDSEVRAFALRYGAFDVRSGWLPDEIHFDPGSFDLVATLDVLEHLGHERRNRFAKRRVRCGWLRGGRCRF